MKTIIIISIFLLIPLSVGADTTVTNSTIGFSVYLPANWVCTQINDSTAVFNDTSFTYKSQITIKKFKRNLTDYPTTNDWTRAHFIAYLLVTNYSYDPFGAVLYYDSTSTCKQNTYWAAEAFSEFYTLDTALGAWDEFIRFTSVGDYGYSLYAIGDTVDMKNNIGMYSAMIQSIHLIDLTNITKVFPVEKSHVAFVNAAVKNGTFDISGKRRPLSAKSHSLTICSQNGLLTKVITVK